MADHPPLTSLQRAKLRSLANTMDPVLSIGKEGVTDTVVKQAWDALEARELIKVSVQRGSPYPSTREACAALCGRTHAEPVQCIGFKFVVYRPARENPQLLSAVMGKG